MKLEFEGLCCVEFGTVEGCGNSVSPPSRLQGAVLGWYLVTVAPDHYATGQKIG
jgi:hypothetical protein